MRTDVTEAVLAGLRDDAISKPLALELLKRLTQQIPIAITGIGALSSTTDDYTEMWKMVRNGGSDIRRASPRRGQLVSTVMPPGTCTNPSDLSKGAYLEDIGIFDHELFGFSAEEASTLMPHAKAVLTAAFRALEDAGEIGASSRPNTGVYVGYNFTKDQVQSFLGLALQGPDNVDHQAALAGSWTSGIATRVSRAFDLRGPSFMIDASCSSSATAIASACEALRNGACDTALAGGLYLDVTPVQVYNRSGLAVTPSDAAVTKLYDRRNVGMYNGEFSGFAVLKPLDRALDEGDAIHGVIDDWTISSNGADGHFNQNSPDSVAQILASLIKRSGLDVEDLGMVIGEGYARPMDEALDTLGLIQGVSRFTDRKQFAALTALTPNFGYLQSAAGIADLIIMVQAIQDRVIPPLPHFDTPTDLLDFVDSPYYIPTEEHEWEVPANGRRRGLIYTYGFGGENSMLIIGSAPEEDPAGVGTSCESASLDAGGATIYTLSAPSISVLKELLAEDLEFLATAAAEDFRRICFSRACRAQVHDRHRIAILAGSIVELAASITEFLSERTDKRTRFGSSEITRTVRRFSNLGDRSAEECAEAFVAGEDLRMHELFSVQDRQMIRLPRYPMRRSSTWPDSAVANAERGSEA